MSYEYLENPDPCPIRVGAVVCLASDRRQALPLTVGRLYPPTTQIPEWRAKLYGVDSAGRMVDLQLTPDCLVVAGEGSSDE